MWSKITFLIFKNLFNQKDKEERKKWLYRTSYVLLLLLLLPVCSLSFPALFGKDEQDIESVDTSFLLENSSVYQLVNNEFNVFCSKVQEQMEQKIEDMKEIDRKQANKTVSFFQYQNTLLNLDFIFTKEVYASSKKTTSSKKEPSTSKKPTSNKKEPSTSKKPTSNKKEPSTSKKPISNNEPEETEKENFKVICEAPPTSLKVYALAYILNQYPDIQNKQDSVRFRKKASGDLQKFFEGGVTIEVKREGTYPNITYIGSVQIDSVENIGKRYFPNSDDQFVMSVESLDMMILDNCDIIEESYHITDLKYPNSGMPIVHYYQNGYAPWANHRYGDGPMSQTACGPTSMAMVISYLTDQKVLPPTVADWSMSKGYYVWGVGTSWSFFPDVANRYGLKCKEISISERALIENLKNGRPIIASMKPGIFTTTGHFICLRGITKDGKILVNDPNDNPQKDFFHKEFNVSLIVNQCKAAWAFSK